MNFSVRSILILSTLLTCMRLHAQDPYYLRIDKLDGLPSNTIYDLFQDSKGFIWVANNEGLTRYDGFEFKTYINESQTSRSGNQVEEDKYGRIWYKNFDGNLYYIENDSLKSLKQNSAIGNTGYAILKDILVVVQKQGIDFFDLGTLKLIRTYPVNIIDFVSELHYKDRFYISADKCLYSISGDMRIETYHLQASAMMAGSFNGIVMTEVTDGQLACYEITEGVAGPKIPLRGVGYLHGFAFCDSRYWGFTPNGVWAYDRKGTNVNNGKAFFADKSISSILKDRDGNYWFGTLNEGILFVPDINTKLFSTPGFVPNILSAVNQKVYIGTKENSIYTYDINTGLFALKAAEPLRHEIICFLADTANNRYSYSSADFFETDSTFRNISRRPANSVKCMVVVDRKYYAFASTGAIGLIKVRDDLESEYDSMYAANLVSNIPHTAQLIAYCRGRAVAYNPLSATIYGGTSIGLFAIRPGGRKELKYNNEALYTKKLICYRNKVYALTPQNQVFEIDEHDAIRNVSLPGEKELYINIKNAGDNLFLLSNNGIRMLDTLSGKVKILNLRPGIRTEEINDLEIVNNRLVFSTERGLIIISDTPSANTGVPPAMVVNSILMNGNIVSKTSDMVFSYKENDMEIQYSILSFGTDRKCQLFYKINDGKWQLNSGATRTLKLASLSPGNYEVSFRLGSSDSDVVFPQQPVKFTISKPFWAEWWFLASCLLVLVSCGYAYYKWQTTMLMKQNLLVVEKIELEKNLRNSMLTSIRSQMNPHFFYNALNSIQSFIFSDDKRNASTYLVKLSKLTRIILEMSEKENISLEEETEALMLYLELEKMRFSADFNYELHMDKNVESDMVKIPPMIVQPYVENAIKHGLLHKKGNKYLSISFSRVNEELVVVIDDNGIGREKAGELRQIKRDMHHPFSTEANNKRIELLNKGRSKNIGVVYTDKKDGNGAPAGTTVTITIPLT